MQMVSNLLIIALGLVVIIFCNKFAVMRMEHVERVFKIKVTKKSIKITKGIFVIAGCGFIVCGILRMFGLIRLYIGRAHRFITFYMALIINLRQCHQELFHEI
jgi:hypothetical protein